MTRRRVLLVAYDFPPAGKVGGRRALRFARYLPDAGWDPIVVAAAPQTVAEPDAETEPNGVDPIDLASTSALPTAATDPDEPVLLHPGALYGKRDLRPIVEAIRQAFARRREIPSVQGRAAAIETFDARKQTEGLARVLERVAQRGAGR